MPGNNSNSVREEINKILGRLHEQNDTMNEMLQDNYSLIVKFSEILGSESATGSETLGVLLQQQRSEIESLKSTINKILDFYSRQINDLTLQNHCTSNNLNGSHDRSSGQILLLEPPRKVPRAQLTDNNPRDLSLPLSSDRSNSNRTNSVVSTFQDPTLLTSTRLSDLSVENDEDTYVVDEGSTEIKITCPYCHNHISLTYGPGDNEN